MFRTFSAAAPSDLLLASYFAVLVALAIFGAHRYRMVYLYFRHRRRRPGAPRMLDELPRVTVQLPVFNELYVVERLIDAVSRLDYPGDRLEIQVLDDSTDETTGVARAAVLKNRARGVDIHYLNRRDRSGFKAGALAAGLERATGELIAIFDADFVPGPGFLRDTVHYFRDGSVGMVQARWGHVNAEYSILTRVQTLLLDAHFVLEHGGRNRAGCFFNFNGTAGIWRRRTIEEAGGWQHDTLTEDMDLSYRAQLRGWRFLFLPDVVVPAELPVSMNAFKSQQQRWSKGSIQTARKLLPRILASPLPLRVKVESLFHLTANLAYPLMVLLSLLMFPSMLVRFDMGFSEMLLFDVPLFLLATASVTSFYVVSQREIYPDWKSRLKVLPMLLALGIGMCVSNARAVLEALAGRETSFVRTPKFRIESSSDEWKSKKYRSPERFLPLVELGLGLYFTVTVAYAATHQIYGSIPFLLLFQAGFLYTGVLSLRESSVFVPAPPGDRLSRLYHETGPGVLRVGALVRDRSRLLHLPSARSRRRVEFDRCRATGRRGIGALDHRPRRSRLCSEARRGRGEASRSEGEERCRRRGDAGRDRKPLHGSGAIRRSGPLARGGGAAQARRSAREKPPRHRLPE